MKCEIMCLPCAEKLRKALNVDPMPAGTNFHTFQPFPGERVRFVFGEAISRYRCDFCNTDLMDSDRCAAVSIYTNKNPYSEWEGIYINPLPKP